MIEHGDDFRLLRQKAPTFQRTKGGGFDTGFRQFKCHSEDALNLLALHFRPGVTDAALLQVATGGTLPGYGMMQVSSAGIEQQEGDRAIIRAEFEGIMWGKPGSVEFSTRVCEQSGLMQKPGYAITRASHLHVPIPTVTHTWCSNRGRPSIVTPGSQIDPPGITETETAQAGQYFEDFLDGMVTVFEDWVLATRNMRSPGNQVSSIIWEVVDVYEYLVTRVSATAEA